MIRTQIYLTGEQRGLLSQLAAGRNEPVSELIREAIDAYLEEQTRRESLRRSQVEQVLDACFGMWADNETDFAAIRASADRS